VLVVVVAAVLVVLVGGGLLVHAKTTSDAPSKAGSTATPSAGPTGKATTKGSTTTKGGSASSEIAPVATQTQAPGAAPTSGTLPGVRPTRRGPLVSDPLPRAASAQGTLVAGYPRRVVPKVPGSTIRSSSVSPSTGRLQVALDARVKASTPDVLRFYAVRLARFGFTSAAAPAVGGSQASSYTRGASSLTVTVTPASSGTVDYTVFGTLHTKS
jgi:hypothetical protein